MPDIYLDYIKSWIKYHQSWTFCFWNDNNIPKLINQEYFDSTNILAMKADILRYELLYIFGGVYVDCDFLCLQNIEKIIQPYSGFSGYESEEYIAIGLMGFIPYDNILKNIIYNIKKNICIYPFENIPKLTGPIFFTEIWNKYKTDKHFAFPINYFYSYTFEDKINNKSWEIHEIKFAIHMWGHSWSNKYINEESNKYFLEYLLEDIIEKYNEKYNEIYGSLSLYLKNIIFFKAKLSTYI